VYRPYRSFPAGFGLALMIRKLFMFRSYASGVIMQIASFARAVLLSTAKHHIAASRGELSAIE
jgi:hypothetical protein